jgi:Toprim-like
MFDILSLIPSKKRKTSNGWYAFNGICCSHRGHNPDKRHRAGLIFTEGVNWSYHCFNCQFKCGFSVGKKFTSNLRSLLEWCGLTTEEIDRLSFKNFLSANSVELYKREIPKFHIEFNIKELPEGARLVDSVKDPYIASYLEKRAMNLAEYPFFTVDNETRQRVIIPYFYKGSVVGHTSRFLDGRKPKYLSDQQRGYVFNLDAQHSDWSSCIITEGQFDALSVGGCAYMGSSITDEQAQVLRELRRKIIVVPDHDKSGMAICDRALQLGFYVSIPEWDTDIKDVNDAVVKYGKLSTILSILRSATSSKIKVEMTRKKFNG